MSLFRKILAGAAALATGAVAACDQAPTSRVLHMRPDGVLQFIDWAASNGPLLVETPVNPFGDGVPSDSVAGIVAEGVKTGIRGRVVTVTTRPTLGGALDYRVRVALAADQGLGTARALCQGDTPPVEAVADDRLTALMVFCEKREMLAAVAGHIPWPAAPEDGQLSQLITQMSRQMFADKPAGS